MYEILVGTSVLAALLGGVVALFAPCCISVMLPAYFATSFRRTRALVSMTFVFGFGVAAIILPISLGASSLSRIFVSWHTVVFLTGGALMISLGVATLAGWKPSLPMPGMRASPDRGPGSVFLLGAFSGVASACCAPVLAGVVALSGAAASFGAALAVGMAYVFGMVAPLFVIALLWDRHDWGNSRLIRGRTVHVRAFGRCRDIHSTALLSGALLVAMGLLVSVLAFTGTAMPSDGWQVELSARLQHYAAVALGWFDGVPGWASALVVSAALAWLAWKALRQQLESHDDPAAEEMLTDQPTGAAGEPTPVAATRGRSDERQVD